jgi:prevent-host-death family protein
MARKPHKITAAALQADCLSWLDQVAAMRRPLVITRRGRPLAKLVPIDDDPVPSLRGSVLREDDIVSPLGDLWIGDA